jgi:flagellar motor switch protein FliG
MVRIGASADKADKSDSMPGIRKVAILMIMIGPEASSALYRALDEDEVQAISKEIARVQKLQPEEAEGVLEEFYQMSVAHDYVIKGGVDYARKVLESAFGPEQARRIFDRLVKTLNTESVSFDALQKTDPQQLAKFIHSEHPQTIALILSHLNPPQAAGLLQSLPAEMRPDVTLRMASLDQISPDIIVKIAAVIGAKLKLLGETSRESYGGVNAVAEMINRLDSNSGREILDYIEKSNASLGETIRHLMFVFEDLMLLDVNAIKELLTKVDRKILTTALKGTSDQLKNRLLEGMSQRGADMLREDMEALGPIKIKEVEAAQQQIIAVVRQLESEGVISLKGAAGEQYVV